MKESKCAKIAASVVKEYGGEITFDAYDAAMYFIRYYTPFHWIAGWGLTRGEKKSNDDKMCAFAAVRLGLLKQTKTGYILS